MCFCGFIYETVHHLFCKGSEEAGSRVHSEKIANLLLGIHSHAHTYGQFMT